MMRAIVKTQSGKGHVELKDVAIPTIKDDEVLIKVKYCGICGTDLHIYHGEYPCTPPLVIGHEFSGVIAAVGKNVAGWKAGDRVVSELHTGICGVCYHCRRGHYLLCAHKKPAGSARDGGMAEFAAMPARLLHRIPAKVSFEEAALTEPAAICVQAIIERSGIRMGDRVAISGAGPIGLLALLVAKAAGAAQVIVSGTARSAQLKLDMAKTLGADRIVIVEHEDLKKVVLEEIDGDGCDLFIEAAGSSLVIKDSPGMIRKGGTICALGVTKDKFAEFPWNDAMFKACRIQFNYSSDFDAWERTLAMMASGKINVRPLITHHFPLHKFDESFKQMEAGEALKILINPEEV